jgi:N-acetylmuramoyl-L-alanine amidase
MTTDWDIQVAKRTCYGEARSEGTAGMLAQAFSIVNRHNAKRWYSGATLAETCLLAIEPQYPQYDCWLSHNAARRPIGDWLATVNTPDDDPDMQIAERAVLQALAQSVPDPTNGATHYFDDSVPTPAWASPPAVFCCRIGKLHFYKNVS